MEGHVAFDNWTDNSTIQTSSPQISEVFKNIGADSEMSAGEIEEAISALAGSDGVLSSEEFVFVLSKK